MADLELISVVIPFYNRSSFLSRLLGSIERQDLLPDKIYVVDNGSNYCEAERAWGIISQCNVAIRCVFVSSIGRGNANYARNLGYQLANSRYVAFLDSDDWWEPDHISSSVSMLKKSGSLGCYSGAYVHKKNGITVNESKDINDFSDAFSFLFLKSGGSAQTSSFVIDKAALGDRIIWDERLKRHQDTDYFVAISKLEPGWVYKKQPSSNIDWSDGGAGPNIDYNSMIIFYNKWRDNIDLAARKSYLLRQIVSCEINKPDNTFKAWYVKEYRSVCGFSFNSLFLTSPIVVKAWKFVVLFPALNFIKKIIFRFYK